LQYPILTQKRLPWQVDAWQKLLSSTNRSLNDLFSHVSVNESDRIAMTEADSVFNTRLPTRLLEQIDKNDLNDPLLRQFLPDPRELMDQHDFDMDPLNEKASQPKPGLLHKYSGRVLLVMTSVCAVHCRYCFRRHFPYTDNRLSSDEWEEICRYIAQDETIEEVILSGGDPLSLKTEVLQRRLEPILSLPHIKRLRIHSRFPVIIPERIDEKLLEWLTGISQEIILVVHVNHPVEVGDSFKTAMDALREKGVHLLNQSVLLKGVNDSVDTLALLSRQLFECGVLPYYLHLLDKVKGAAHFDLSSERAHSLYQALLARLPGYLVPKMVREIAGERSKTVAL